MQEGRALNRKSIYEEIQNYNGRSEDPDACLLLCIFHQVAHRWLNLRGRQRVCTSKTANQVGHENGKPSNVVDCCLFFQKHIELAYSPELIYISSFFSAVRPQILSICVTITLSHQLLAQLTHPSTLPTTLYLFEKNVIQSSRTFFLSSSKSSQSGRTSSGFVEERARAREASWPANTVCLCISICGNIYRDND